MRVEFYQVSDALSEAFKGTGRAIRRKEEKPLPGEPYMSMDDAVVLGSRAVFKLLSARRYQMERATLSVATIGIMTAVVAGVLYFMALPIFDAIDLAWVFVVGLVAGAVAIGSLIIKSVWENHTG